MNNKSGKRPFSSDHINTVYKRRCSSLQKGCEEVQQENCKLVNRIYQVKKIIRRFKKEKSYLLQRLANHGEDISKLALSTIPMECLGDMCENSEESEKHLPRLNCPIE